MIRDETGGRPKVIGSSMAMVATGPRPGSTPTAVPSSTPMKQYMQVERAERRGEAEPEIGEQFHGGSLLLGLAAGGAAVMPERWARATSNRR